MEALVHAKVPGKEGQLPRGEILIVQVEVAQDI